MAENDEGANPEPGTGPASGANESQLPPRRKPPVTIDLAATPIDSGDEPTAEAPPDAAAAEAAPASVESEASGDTPPPADESPPSTIREGIAVAPLAIAALVGAIAALLVGFGFQATGIIPTPAAGDAHAALELAGKHEQQIAVVESAAARTATELQALSARLAGVETLARDLLATTEQLRGLDGTTAATEARLDRLAAQLSDLEAAMKDLGPGGPSDLEQRIAALTDEVNALSARLTRFAENPPVDRRTAAAARAMAFAGLRSAADSGESFGDALEMLHLLGVDATALSALDAAKEGVPSNAALAARFNAVADDILSASEAPPADADILSRLWRQARTLVTIRPAGPIAGATPEAIVSRMRAAVSAGDLEAALKEREGLPDSGRAASAAWIRDVAARIALDRAVGSLAQAIETASPGQ